MKHFPAAPFFCVLLLTGLLAGCGGAATPGQDGSAEVAGEVAVTTMIPVQQTFHTTVEAWGSVIGDPHQTRAISLAHGGQVVAVRVEPAQTVMKGQALLTVRPDATARNAWQQAQSALTLARGEFARTEQLARQRLATQSQLAATRKALADAEAALTAQRMLGGASVEETVSAPTDGVVSTLGIGLGERFAANAPLLSFTPAHALVAQLGVPPEDGVKLHVGLPVLLHAVYGVATDVSGSLSMVGQAIDPQSHLLPAQVRIAADAGATLVAGTSLQAQILTSGYTAWAVPRLAVLHDDKGDYLFQVDKGHAKRVDVTLRNPDGDTVGVQGALDAQAKVIVLGAYELSGGEVVRESTR